MDPTIGFACLWKVRNLCFTFAQQRIHELQAFIYDAVKQRSPLSFLSWNGLLCQHGGVQGKHYTLIDLQVHGSHIESSPIFVACFNRELRMIDYLSTCNLFPTLLLYKSSLSLFQLPSAITPRQFSIQG